MKKILFVLLLCCCTCPIFAQENTDTSAERKRTKIKVKTKANANDMRTSTDMQTGTINNNMGSSTFATNTRITIQGWRTDPASLPVIGTGVTADVVTTIKSKYGNNIYDIKKIKVTSGQDAYAVRVMENGQYTIYYVGADGNVVPK